MMNNEDFEAYLDLCERMAQRLYDEGKWPFRDPANLPNDDDLVDSNS